ncbi:hypothetical protein HOP50_03g22530 [Chloropicon primus]|uniref:Phytanoyl-CoA dioxygenase n=1 Tax=Chloropicon primus TaxID=1764295 RepID=A0A5B8MH14_9CHLO|nr:hypothetical protein A3770_03p22540 [Chloropicon primus]UPQ98947.1 hypothetical protein HOP50_03g22530 [Chloropicon primus]|eukprot:QDZ19736.1 hypothetical protein A3770_03p22540 [Chloropicon primus]
MKSVIDFEEAKRFRTYLTSVVSPRTLDGEEYFVGNLRDPDGRYDIRLDPREHAPVMDMLNKVVGRLKPTLEKIVGPKAELVDFSAYVTCNSSAQHTHQDACALCCPIKDKYESRMEEVESIFDFNDRDRIAILKPKYYANKEQSQVYSMFVALQPTTKERNGVTFTYPDSHRLFVWDNAEDDIAGESVERELGDVARKKYQRCEPPLNTGDGFIYNSKTFHAANANPSISARMMLLIAFQSGEERKGLPLGSTYSIQRDFLRMQPGKVTRTGMEDEPDYYSTKCMTQANTAASNQMKVRGKVSLDKFPLTVDSLSSILASGNNLFFGR